MVCLRNISVDTLHNGDTEDNNNNNEVSVMLFPVHAVMAYRRRSLELHLFLIWALGGVEWSHTRSGRFTPEINL